MSVSFIGGGKTRTGEKNTDLSQTLSHNVVSSMNENEIFIKNG